MEVETKLLLAAIGAAVSIGGVFANVRSLARRVTRLEETGVREDMCHERQGRARDALQVVRVAIERLTERFDARRNGRR